MADFCYKNCPCCIIHCFEATSIEMNMTKQTVLNLMCIFVTNWDVNCGNCWMNGLPKPIVQFSAVEDCLISKLGISINWFVFAINLQYLPYI